MQCEKCGFDNHQGMHFCGRCAARLGRACPNCHFINEAHSVNCSQCSHNLSDISSRFPIEISRHDNAERRQLTILFCDLVDSSALSATIDPEDLRDIMREYHTACNEVVARFGGHIAQHLGDGILVYFGHPRVHEDDARRAVYTGLEIIQRLSRLHFHINNNTDIQLSVRVGIHTGLVVVGEIGAEDKRVLALGEAPNIAARIQNHARKNTLLVSATTHNLLGQEFESISLGFITLKGFSQQLELFHVVQFRKLSNKISITGRDNNIALIGRKKESTLLLEKLRKAENGTGQIVLLNGEPGLGKTRLAQFIRDNTILDQCTLMECSGLSFYQHSFFHPILQITERMLDITNDMKDDEKISRIEHSLINLGLDTDVSIPILANLLSIPIYSKYPVNIESTPQQKKQLSIDIFLDILNSLAKQNFILLIIEDIQWIDPSTLELLSQFINQRRFDNIFALFTFRTDFPIPFPIPIPIPIPNRDHITRISLEHFNKEESGRLIRNLCGDKSLPEIIQNRIIEKTDGVPFFIEEVTNNLLHSEHIIERENHYELNVPLTSLDIPSTLMDSLASKLDSLGENRQLAQLCSILGREFYYELLSAVCEYEDDILWTSMEGLVKSKVLYRHKMSPSLQYSFRHALLHDAAYQSLLKRTRHKYHQKIADIIKDKFPDIITDNPEVIAYHYTMAGNYEDSLDYWLEAGHYAIRGSANIEAATHFSNGLKALTKLPNTKEHRLKELKFQVEIGQALILCKGYAAPEVKQAFDRAWELCDGIDDINIIFPVLVGLWEYNIARAEMNIALDLATRIKNLTIDSGNKDRIGEAERITGTTHFWRGEFSQALFHLNKNLSSEPPPKTNDLSPHYQETNVAALANAGCALWLAGKTEESLKIAQSALDLAKHLTHPFSQAYALQFLMTIYQLNGDHEAVSQYADTQITLSKTYRFPFWEAMGRMMAAWANADREPNKLHLSTFREALHDYEVSGNKLARSYFYSLYAEILKNSGNYLSGKETIDRAIKEAELSGEKYYLAEMLRIKAMLLCVTPAGNNSSKAEQTLNRAQEIANTQGAKALLLKIATSLSQLGKAK